MFDWVLNTPQELGGCFYKDVFKEEFCDAMWILEN